MPKEFDSPFSIDMDLYPEFEQQDNRFSRSNYKSKYRGISKCSSIQNYKTNIFEAKDGKYELSLLLILFEKRKEVEL